ncbi:hypothetical protein Q8A67_015333 [Cirrhinus molitorella]|uniref:Uncharacterized protein n=2 Tax=Cirrhinus molitorella TaxID=172907 RepID=A0AA88TJZ7_9TELE|nr:hypothetical protein Q8A67_015333 [Cirrhinus molitorella]
MFQVPAMDRWCSLDQDKLSGVYVSERQRELSSPDSCIKYRSQATQTDLLRREIRRQREERVHIENWTKTLKGSSVCFGYELMFGGQEEKFGLMPVDDVLWARSGAQPWNCRESCTGSATGPGGPGPVTGSSTKQDVGPLRNAKILGLAGLNEQRVTASPGTLGKNILM